MEFIQSEKLIYRYLLQFYSKYKNLSYNVLYIIVC